MKVVFLDIDGVLSFDAVTIDIPSLKRLKRILDETGAKVVLSSAWRIFPDGRDQVKEALKSIGHDMLDCTPEDGPTRGAEINQWLREHPEVENFVIIDDDYFDMKDDPILAPKIVKTEFEDIRHDAFMRKEKPDKTLMGLTERHMKDALFILNRK